MRQLQRWDEVLTSEETNAFAMELSVILVSRIRDDEARGKLRDFIDHDDLLGLSDYGIDYTRLPVLDCLVIRQIQALFQKRKDLGDDTAREINALQSFRQAEQRCRDINDTFKAWKCGRFQFYPRVERAFHYAQRKIASVLGDVPELSELHLRFGPGATTNVPKRNASARTKLGAPFACSEELAGYVSDVLEEVPSWAGLKPSASHFELSLGGSEYDESRSNGTLVTVEIHDGKLAFVPKDRRTFRTIATEPTLNQFVQLGYGKHIAECLRRFGVDIRDQRPNQRAARSGSIDGELATLDLSSASDCISIGLVEHLLPPDWFDALSRCRTGTVKLEGDRIKLEKFSTMGNGFTFSLETLIFWALALSVCERNDTVLTYGDDIIVPSSRFHAVSEVLWCAGFSVNTKKSFASGPFRESCGVDYLSGIDIRPIYLHDRLNGQTAFRLYNFWKLEFDDELCDVVLSYIAPELQIWGPKGYGDGVLVEHEYARHLQTAGKRATHGYGGYTFEAYTWKHLSSTKLSPGDHILPSYSIYLRGSPVVDWSEEYLIDEPYWTLKKSNDEFARADRLKSQPETYTYVGGKLVNTKPGKKGYKRIKIYVFA